MVLPLSTRWPFSHFLEMRRLKPSALLIFAENSQSANFQMNENHAGTCDRELNMKRKEDENELIEIIDLGTDW